MRNGSLPWSRDLAGRAARLAQDLADASPADLAAALEAELYRRADDFATGIEAYRRHPYARAPGRHPAIWQDGTTRLLDYGPHGGKPVLVVPSLINRGYILDLLPERSFLDGLVQRGVRPLLVEWNAPGDEERTFDLSAYVAGRLDQALDAALDLAGGAVPIAGYCMGGLLALALAQRRRRDTTGLVLLATPWDFQAGDAAAYAGLLGALARPIEAGCALSGELSTDMLQCLFSVADPSLVIRKFSRFARLDPAAPEAIRFVATEDWLNDGVPLALRVATECLGGWYGENLPARGLWRIAGRPVRPELFNRPALVVQPAHDRIVPPASAAALARQLPRVEILTPRLGHIGIIVGSSAPDEVWDPVAAWLGRL